MLREDLIVEARLDEEPPFYIDLATYLDVYFMGRSKTLTK